MSTLFDSIDEGVADVEKQRGQKRSANLEISQEHRRNVAAEAAKK